MKSTVLAIGTELTDGQIINRNAAWLAERLKKIGARCEVHLTIPDDRALILESLDQCAKHGELIFVSGGLGPTSDDFTRELISEWAKAPLEFHEPSWAWINERLGGRGYPVTEIQRQQCYFPKGAVVLHNAHGTANAFRLRARDREIVVLPGPPREIQAIWEDHLEAWLNELCRNEDPLVTRSWDLIGLGESQVAELAVPLLAASKLEVGYRVHMPYVEFKVSYPRSQTLEHETLVQSLSTAFGGFVATRDGEDVVATFAQGLAGVRSFEIIDELTGAFLMQRIAAPLANLWNDTRWSVRREGPPDEDCEVGFWIRAVNEFEAEIGIRRHRQPRRTTIVAPMKSSALADRRKQYFLERALAWWTAELRE